MSIRRLLLRKMEITSYEPTFTFHNQAMKYRITYSTNQYAYLRTNPTKEK